MAQREYKQLSCRDVGGDCDFLVRSEKKEEVMSLIAEHACRVHKNCELPSDLKDRMQASMKSICCQGECYPAPKMYWQTCWDSF